MKDLAGEVAVMTGAGSGIGRAMAERFAAEGMKVVLADVERAALARLPHPEWKNLIRTRMEDILAEREPTVSPMA